MAPISASADPIQSAEARRIERQQRDERTVVRAARPTYAAGGPSRAQDELSLLQTRIERWIDDSFDDRPESRETEAYMASDEGVDPDATAEAIVSRALKHFKAFEEAHPAQDVKITFEEFIERVRNAIDEGFRETLSAMHFLRNRDSDVIERFDDTRKGIHLRLAGVEPPSRMSYNLPLI